MKQILILLTVFLTTFSAFSTEYYVDASRPDDSGAATNWATAKQTIQAAVDLAMDEDTVWVTNGVYATGGVVAPVYQDMYFLGIEWVNSLTNRVCVSANVTVRSVNGPAVTIIQGASDNGTPGPAAVRCAYLLSGAVMEGFTLTSGYTSGAGGTGEFLDQIGGGVLLLTNSLLNNCVLFGNSAIGQGGGAACYQGGILNNCVINRNSAYQGGGVFCEMGGVLNNCTVSQNTANYGGGVDMLNDSSINNCIVWGNTAGIVGDNINMQGGCIRYTCSSPLPEGEGNICADPMFKNPGSNFRLKQGSPCVDAGSNGYAPATDLDGVARPVDGDNNGSAIADMGCYELNAASLPKTYYVDASRPDDSGAATNWATAKQTIQAAVDLAADEDTVWVTNGVYSTGGTVAPPFVDPGDYYGSLVTSALTNRVCITKAITVRSVNGPEVTVIQGASDNGANGPAAVRCVHLFPGAVMEGFTLTEGHTYADSNGGWGADCGGGAFLLGDAVLNNCALSENSAYTAGGGVCCFDGGTLNNCLLNGNTAGWGGGAAGGGTLNSCTVSGNTAREFSTPYGTRGGIGGGVDLSSSVLNNCIVWGNTAVNGINIWGSDSTIRNTCSDPLPAGAGNICADPMFKNSGSNFRLKQGSPCVDAGSTNGYVLATDLDGVARPVDGDNNGSAIADMGCYELNAASLPKTYYVDASRPDDSGAATNWATAKQTIQAAVDLAADEDAVLVTNGVYATGGMVAPVYSAADPANALTNRVCITKAITVRSVNGAEVTIIQGASDNGANGPAAMRCTYLAAGAVMEGFTLTGGHILGDWSRGLFDNFGGGALVFTNAELNRCILNENFALYGGGAFLWGGMLNNCRLSGNSTVYDGGGACLDNGGTLNNCTLAGNTAADGSGVFAPNGTLNNCIVWGNTAVNGSNIEAVSSTIRNTCSSPLPEGEGNICADPMFKNSSSNFRLKQGSPCVDAGSNDYAPATDLDGVARPVDGDNSGVAVADMGCYELNAASLPKTFYVDASRPDDSGVATNWATAKQTIQAAVDLATDGDTVLVTNGVYSTGGMVAPPFHEPYNDGSIVTSELTNRVCITKAITVRSVNGAEVTVIQGAGESGSLATARCAYLFPGAVMEGFTLTGGYTMQYDGGGYSDWMGGGAFLLTNAVLNDCVLIENFAWSDGGGAFCSYGGTLNNCLLIRNTALSGGGAAMGPGGVLNNCLLSDNTSGFEGGGVILWNGGVLNNCTVNGNSADGAGGGVRSHSGTLNNCIVWGNTGASANIYVDGESTIRNTCSDPLPEGDGNIFADPMFDGNHLQASSPCINAGNNSYVSTTNDLAGNPRIVASVVDMGAYEFTGLPGDFDCDGLSDEWETRHFGNINRAVATAICSNGVNTIREAYIAGLDPNDAAAFFEMDGDRTAGKSVLWWNATSGRVYSVYFSTNLMNGFQPLETNIPWTAGAFTDSVHNAYGQGYYKIDVKLDD